MAPVWRESSTFRNLQSLDKLNSFLRGHDKIVQQNFSNLIGNKLIIILQQQYNLTIVIAIQKCDYFYILIDFSLK